MSGDKGQLQVQISILVSFRMSWQESMKALFRSHAKEFPKDLP